MALPKVGALRGNGVATECFWLQISGLTLLGIGAITAHHLVPVTTPYGDHADRTVHVHQLSLLATMPDGSSLDMMLRAALAMVHHGFHILLVTGFLYAAWDRYHAWRGLTNVLRLVETRCPRPRTRLWKAAQAAKLDPARVYVVRWLPDPAFTVGWLRPAVYVAQPLVSQLSMSELVGVLAHEHAHMMRRDPLRLAVLRFIACGLFWIPVLRQLMHDVTDETEVRADDAALTYEGTEPVALASAIMRAAQLRTGQRVQPKQWGAWGTMGAIGLVRTNGYIGNGSVAVGLLERRVRRLIGEDPPVATHVTRMAVIIATLTLFLGWLSGIVMGV